MELKNLEFDLYYRFLKRWFLKNLILKEWIQKKSKDKRWWSINEWSISYSTFISIKFKIDQ